MITHLTNYTSLRDSWGMVRFGFLELRGWFSENEAHIPASMRPMVAARVQMAEADLQASSDILCDSPDLVTDTRLDDAAQLVLHATEQIVRLGNLAAYIRVLVDEGLPGTPVGQA